MSMRTLLLVAVILLIAGFVALNFEAILQPNTLNLGFWEIQAPLGMVMLVLDGVLFAILVLIALRSHVGSLLESRKLLRELQRLQALADKAEASRVESLQQFMAEEFRQLNQRLQALAPGAPPRLTQVP